MKHSRRTADFLLAQRLLDYLRKKGVTFDRSGFPVFKSEWFLKQVPNEMFPFYRRNWAKDKSKCVIVFYSDDRDLYRRVERVFDDLMVYKEFMGCGPMDISVDRKMDRRMQAFNALLNALFNAVLGVNGIRLFAPLRFGGPEALAYQMIYKDATIGCIGLLGSHNLKPQERDYVRTCFTSLKVTCPRIRSICLYGKREKVFDAFLTGLGYRTFYYQDFNFLSRRHYNVHKKKIFRLGIRGQQDC